MDFDTLVKFIRVQGCKVIVHDEKKKVDETLGYFIEDPKPQIHIATKGRKKYQLISTLLHEYAHFLQWEDGFLKYMDGICLAYNLWDDWLTGYVELNKREKQIVRNAILSIEYDAEIRAYNLGIQLKLKHFNPTYHLQTAQSYVAAIKWSFLCRKDWKKRVGIRLWPAKKLSFKKLFAPLKKREKKFLKKMKVKPRD